MSTRTKKSLIAEVQKRRNIYDNKDRFYNDKDARFQAFHDISVIINRECNVIETADSISSKWKTIRNAFTKLDKKKCAGETLSTKDEAFYQSLQFVQPFIKHKDEELPNIPQKRPFNDLQNSEILHSNTQTQSTALTSSSSIANPESLNCNQNRIVTNLQNRALVRTTVPSSFSKTDSESLSTNQKNILLPPKKRLATGFVADEETTQEYSELNDDSVLNDESSPPEITKPQTTQPNSDTLEQLPGQNRKQKTNISEEQLIDAALEIQKSTEQLKNQAKLKSRAKVLTKSLGQVDDKYRPECILKLIEIAKRFST